jgi:hypothetical protein
MGLALAASLFGCSQGDIAVEQDKPIYIQPVPKGAGTATTSSTDALVNVVAYHWKSHTVLDEVAVVLEDVSGNQSSEKGFTSRILPVGTYQVSVSPPAGSGSRETAIDLKDALATLKLAIGVESINGTDTSGKPVEVSAYQRAAADFNADGKVDLKDALEILKYSIGVPVSTSARWQYFHDTEVIAAGSPPKVELSGATRAVAVSATTSVGVAAVLTGDVDGSWRPSQTTAQVDPTYYTGLVSGLQTTDKSANLARWGIYDGSASMNKTVVSRTYLDGVETITYSDGSQVKAGSRSLAMSFSSDGLMKYLTYFFDNSQTPTIEKISPSNNLRAQPLSLSSYENKINSIKSLGPISLTENFGQVKTGSSDFWLSTLAGQIKRGNAFVFADFFGDGDYSMFVHTFEYDFTFATANNIGHIKFFRFLNGKWVEKTSDILENSTGCLHARKAVVSDFNKDGKPDVFVACTGVDSDPFPGEPSLLLLSTPTGKYQKSFLNWAKTFTHSASAADLNNDGYADLVVTDFSNFRNGGIGVLMNNKDGSFKFRTDLMPSVDAKKTSFTAELVKFNGRPFYDLFISSHETDAEWNHFAQVIENSGNGSFGGVVRKLPSVAGYGLTIDVIYDSGYLYLDRVTDMPVYENNAIQKVSYPDLKNSVLMFAHASWYPNWEKWVNWIGFYGDKIISIDSDYGLSILK